MGAPVLLAENFYSQTIFPDVLLSLGTPTEEVAGHELSRVADGRRSILDYFTSKTTNTIESLIMQFTNVSRPADCIALDRGHNLGGKTVTLYYSDNGSVWTSIMSPTIPASSTPGTSIDASNGAVTEEGAWIKRFPVTSNHPYYRFDTPAMVGTVPVIVGLWLGKCYVPPTGFYLPWDEDQNDLLADEIESPFGWRGRGALTTIRRGQFTIKMDSIAAYDSAARYHIQQLFGKGRPTWICYDDAAAERSFLAIRPTGRLSLPYAAGWWPRAGQPDYVEHEPVLP